MSNRKKIFHKPDDKIPSADDILNYLNEEETSLEKPSPAGGSMDAKRKKISKSEISKDEQVSEEEIKIQRSAPAPSMESSAMPKNFRGKGIKNSKKKHELEKAMLSDPLVSDAVEGYHLLANKNKARHLIDEINQTISNQTQKKNDRAVVMRIAALLLVIFMISGGSFYLFNSFSSKEMAAVFSDKREPVANAGINTDTTDLAAKDSMHQLAIESENMSPAISKGELKALTNDKPVSTDGYISPEEISNGPVLLDENTDLVKKEANGSGRSKPDEERITNMLAPVPGYQIQQDTLSLPKKDQLAINSDKMEMKEKEDGFFDLKNTSSQEVVIQSEKKTKRKGNYATPSTTRSRSIDDLSESGKKGASLEEGISLYNQTKFKEAGEIFEGVLQSQPSNQEAIYYSGMSDYQLKFYDKSLATLSKVSSSSRHYDEARWYKALIFIASGQKEEARKLLKELSKPGNSYSDRAIDELKKID